jgi:hypothetical protein
MNRRNDEATGSDTSQLFFEAEMPLRMSDDLPQPFYVGCGTIRLRCLPHLRSSSLL